MRWAVEANMQAKISKWRWSGVVFAICLTGCMAPVGSSLRIPTNAADMCRKHCAEIGLALSAVAIMADNVGCVCQERGEGRRSAADRDAVTAGMATILLQDRDEAPR
jgi:hypothetical protein